MAKRASQTTAQQGKPGNQRDASDGFDEIAMAG
jgi:hypothetical protein